MAKNITFRVLLNSQTFLFGKKVSWIYFTLASLKKQEKKITYVVLKIVRKFCAVMKFKNKVNAILIEQKENFMCKEQKITIF